MNTTIIAMESEFMNCFSESVRENTYRIHTSSAECFKDDAASLHADFLILQIENPACYYMDRLYELYQSGCHPFIILFHTGTRPRYTTSYPLDVISREQQDAISAYLYALKTTIKRFSSPAEEPELYSHIGYHSTRYEKTEYLREILSGVSNKVFSQITNKTVLDLQPRNYYLYLMSTTNNNIYNDYAMNRDVMYFLEELRREAVYQILHEYSGGEMFGATRFTNCILINAPHTSSLLEQQQFFTLISKKLHYVTGSAYRAFFISGMIQEPCDINDAFQELMHLTRYKIFFPHAAVLTVDHIRSQKKMPDIEAINALLQLIRSYTEKTSESDWKDALHTLFTKHLKEYVSITMYYYCCSTLNVKLQEFSSPLKQPDLIRFSPLLEFDMQMTVAEIEELYITKFLGIRKKLLSRSILSPDIQEVLLYIDEHYKETLTLQSIAGHVGLSRTYLSKKFNRCMGINLAQYITNYRIEKAKELFRSTSLKVYEVAEMTGFKDGQYFSRVFHSVTGKTPRQYVRETR